MHNQRLRNRNSLGRIIRWFCGTPPRKFDQIAQQSELWRRWRILIPSPFWFVTLFGTLQMLRLLETGNSLATLFVWNYWRFEHFLTSNSIKSSKNFSKNVLDINNITSTLFSLYCILQTDWPQDYLNSKPDKNDALHLFLILPLKMKRHRHCNFSFVICTFYQREISDEAGAVGRKRRLKRFDSSSPWNYSEFTVLTERKIKITFGWQNFLFN